MRIGTTPMFTFNLPLHSNSFKEFEITFKQCNEIFLQKYSEDCLIEDYAVHLSLTEEETFGFLPNKDLLIELRALTNEDKVVSSGIYRVSASECLSNAVLSKRVGLDEI